LCGFSKKREVIKMEEIVWRVFVALLRVGCICTRVWESAAAALSKIDGFVDEFCEEYVDAPLGLPLLAESILASCYFWLWGCPPEIQGLWAFLCVWVIPPTVVLTAFAEF